MWSCKRGDRRLTRPVRATRALAPADLRSAARGELWQRWRHVSPSAPAGTERGRRTRPRTIAQTTTPDRRRAWWPVRETSRHLLQLDPRTAGTDAQRDAPSRTRERRRLKSSPRGTSAPAPRGERPGITMASVNSTESARPAGNGDSRSRRQLTSAATPDNPASNARNRPPVIGLPCTTCESDAAMLTSGIVIRNPRTIHTLVPSRRDDHARDQARRHQRHARARRHQWRPDCTAEGRGTKRREDSAPSPGPPEPPLG